MEALEFLRRYRYDDRLITGRYYPDAPLRIEPGDRIGVVLLNLGGPHRGEDVEGFLYNLFMDPAIIDIPLKGRLRNWLCRLIASKRSEKVREEYALIGGGSPINRLTILQSDALQDRLNDVLGPGTGATFHTYVAMRYWKPTSEDTARRMRADAMNKVVLLPLYPHYSKTTTGSSLHYWWMLEEAGEIEKRPTIAVKEYAAHPSYVASVNARIDEALERFPVDVRNEVHLLFSAHGTPLKEMKVRKDPYCCLVHSTVDRVMKARDDHRPFDVSFQSKVGPGEWLTPGTPEKLEELAKTGRQAVLVVPIAFVSDHVETAFELDIEVRHEAEAAGIEHYVVSGGLNDHPLFIDALADVVARHLDLPPRPGGVSSGDGTSYEVAATCFKPSERKTACHQCLRIVEARKWTAPEAIRQAPG